MHPHVDRYYLHENNNKPAAPLHKPAQGVGGLHEGAEAPSRRLPGGVAGRLADAFGVAVGGGHSGVRVGYVDAAARARRRDEQRGAAGERVARFQAGLAQIRDRLSPVHKLRLRQRLEVLPRLVRPALVQQVVNVEKAEADPRDLLVLLRLSRKNGNKDEQQQTHTNGTTTKKERRAPAGRFERAFRPGAKTFARGIL